MASGSGVIEYRGKRGTVWRIKYRDADGRQVMETVGAERDGVTRKQAAAELRERVVRVERKGYRRPKAITWGEYADTWLEDAAQRRDWKPHTLRGNRDSIRRLRPFFGAARLDGLRPRDITAFVREALAEYAPSTVNLDVNVLVDTFNTAIREELIETNPAIHAERPKLPRKRWRILEPREVARVANAIEDPVAHVMFLTLVLTGVRRFELYALRWTDVDLLARVLRVRDSKSEDGIRSIALSRRLVEALEDHWQRTPYRSDRDVVFADLETGRPYSAKRFGSRLTAALAEAGIEARVRAFHDLRHTAITNDAASGSNPIAVMTKAGHANMSTTQTYLHLAGVIFRDEADALELRLLGAVESSTRLTEPHVIEDDLERPNRAGSGLSG